MKKNSKENRPWYLDTIERCKILYKDYYRPCTETCMCWGFECGEGLKRPLDNLSDILESLNIHYYPKYKVRVQADQLKSKFGFLRYYYSVVIDPPWYCTFLGKPFKTLGDYLKYKINYKIIRIKDEPDLEKTDCQELKDIKNDQEFEDYKKKYNYSTITYEKKDGKYYKYTKYTKIGRSHYEPSKHKILYKLYHLMYKISSILTWYKNPTREQEVISNTLDVTAERLIRITEDECYNTCEECGRQIGTTYSPRCKTTGWITYLCEDCAKKRNKNYIKDDSIYNNGNFIKKVYETHESI